MFKANYRWNSWGIKLVKCFKWEFCHFPFSPFCFSHPYYCLFRHDHHPRQSPFPRCWPAPRVCPRFRTFRSAQIGPQCLDFVAPEIGHSRAPVPQLPCVKLCRETMRNCSTLCWPLCTDWAICWFLANLTPFYRKFSMDFPNKTVNVLLGFHLCYCDLDQQSGVLASAELQADLMG